MRTPIKVMIVEDDEASLVVLEYLIQALSFEAVTATDVAGARAVLAEMTPDVAILDVMLPDGDGAEILAQIRENGLPISVALMTATHDQPKLYKCAAWKPDAMFSKPLDANAIAGWLGQQMARIKLSKCSCPIE